METYFDVRPLQFKDLELQPANFVSRSEFQFPEDPHQLLIATFSSAPVQGEGTTFVLDFDMIGQNLERVVDQESSMELVNHLRRTERVVFESAITEDTRRDLFGGYEERTDG